MKTLLLLITICISTLSAQPKEFKLYYLGGQSNMEGLGLTSELPEEYKTHVENVWIFSGNIVEDNEPNGGLGIWTPLKTGFGYEFSSDGEQNFNSNDLDMETIAELENDNPITIIKYPPPLQTAQNLGPIWLGPDFFGGEGINQYDNFLATLRNAISDRDIDNDERGQTNCAPMTILNWILEQMHPLLIKPIPNPKGSAPTKLHITN